MTYRAPTFLSDDTFLMVNLRKNTIDFIRIGDAVSSNGRCQLIGTLWLPALREGSLLTSVSCCTDPVPSAPGRPGDYQQQRRCPIRCRAEKAIIQFCIYAREAGAEADDNLKLFAFVARRGDLLKVVQDRPRADNGEAIPIPWDHWGPDLTRWCESEETETAWAAGVAGQRQVFSRTGLNHAHLRDFSSAAADKAKEGLFPKTVVLHSARERTNTTHQNCFQKDIVSTLPFVEVISAEQVDYDNIFLDEECVVGLRVSHTSPRIHYLTRSVIAE